MVGACDGINIECLINCVRSVVHVDQVIIFRYTGRPHGLVFTNFLNYRHVVLSIEEGTALRNRHHLLVLSSLVRRYHYLARNYVIKKTYLVHAWRETSNNMIV